MDDDTENFVRTFIRIATVDSLMKGWEACEYAAGADPEKGERQRAIDRQLAIEAEMTRRERDEPARYAHETMIASVIFNPAEREVGVTDVPVFLNPFQFLQLTRMAVRAARQWSDNRSVRVPPYVVVVDLPFTDVSGRPVVVGYSQADGRAETGTWACNAGDDRGLADEIVRTAADELKLTHWFSGSKPSIPPIPEHSHDVPDLAVVRDVEHARTLLRTAMFAHPTAPLSIDDQYWAGLGIAASGYNIAHVVGISKGLTVAQAFDDAIAKGINDKRYSIPRLRAWAHGKSADEIKQAGDPFSCS